jgi:hypothetical protein
MTKNNVVIGTIVAVTVALIITASTVPTVLAQQAGNMTGGGGDLEPIPKLSSWIL